MIYHFKQTGTTELAAEDDNAIREYLCIQAYLVSFTNMLAFKVQKNSCFAITFIGCRWDIQAYLISFTALLIVFFQIR